MSFHHTSALLLQGARRGRLRDNRSPPHQPAAEEEPLAVMMEMTPTAAGTEVPPRSASFEEKMAYYRSQHTTTGVRATHLVGIPAVAAALPLIAARPRAGVPLFLAGWALQVPQGLREEQPGADQGPVHLPVLRARLLVRGDGRSHRRSLSPRRRSGFARSTRQRRGRRDSHRGLRPGPLRPVRRRAQCSAMRTTAAAASSRPPAC